MGMGPESFTPVEMSPLSRQTGTSRPGGRVYPFHGDEEVANVNGGNTFAVVQFPVNPGQNALFPWLSKEASLYERYVFTQLEFYYKTLLNAISATAVGKVVYSMDFDASDAPPTTKQQAMDSEPAESCAPWENMALIIPPYQLESCFTDAKYVRPGGLPGAADIKTYDLGNLNVVTDSNTNTTALGELHVRYAGFFMNRVLDSTTTAPNNNSVSLFQSTSSEASGASTVATPLLFATTTANGLLIANASGTFNPPAGNYLVDVSAVATNSVQGDLETITLDIKKNGTSVFTTALSKPSQEQNGGPFAAGNSVSATFFVVANGADTFTFPLTVTYAGGVNTQAGTVRWVAV